VAVCCLHCNICILHVCIIEFVILAQNLPLGSEENHETPSS
jgi:hypothetical protein